MDEIIERLNQLTEAHNRLFRQYLTLQADHLVDQELIALLVLKTTNPGGLLTLWNEVSSETHAQRFLSIAAELAPDDPLRQLSTTRLSERIEFWRTVISHSVHMRDAED